MKKLILALIVLLALPVVAQDRVQPAARLVSAENSTEIIRSDGQRDPGVRRESVFEADSIETGLNGSALVRFSNGVAMSLGCNSLLTITRYNTGEEIIELNLQRGRIRAVTGSSDTENYQLVVNSAKILIVTSKADFEVIEESPNQMSYGVYQGSIEISNNYGALTMGTGKDFNFSRAVRGQAPMGIATMPSSMQVDANCE